MPRTWFITGSSRGLGRALAEAVLDAGDRLVATARRPDDLAELVQRGGDRALALPLDVTDPAAARRAIDAAVARFGRIDVLVNNAGYADLQSIEDTSEESFRAQIETNLWGVINVTRAALPQLREQGGGARIIQVSSVGGRMSSPGLGPYQTAKWAVGGFSGVLGAEVAPLGIKVTTVEPGGMKTDWGGASMAIESVSPPYETTVGARAAMMGGFAEFAEATGESTAAAIMKLSTLEDPPARLVLGSGALDLATAAGRALLESDLAHEELSRSTTV
jgi:NAD(P)-dependent dehydrogenase (short-subunit alcohol dehydrogenase family)